MLKSANPNNHALTAFVSQLSTTSEYKNVWVQVINAQGISIARSWTNRAGDNLANIRKDVREMIANPQNQATISVGHYDLSYKAMAPIYDQNNQFLGFLEMITHFNSIAEKLKAKGFESVVLVNEKFYSQLTHPFTNKFADKHYVANLNAHWTLSSKLKLTV